MKTKVAPIVIALVFFSALISSDSKLVKGQTAPKDKQIRLSKYGVVLTTPTANNNKTRDLHYEGYAISYRAKNSRTGKEEDRLAYAFGPHQVSNLKPVKQKAGQAIVQTQDGQLEITSEVKWDHKLNELRTWRSFKVIGKTEIVVLAIESYVDNQHERRDADLTALIEAALGLEQRNIIPGLKCDCPPCPIEPCPDPEGFKLKSDRLRALLNPEPALIAGEMLKGNPVSALSWKANRNMTSELMPPGSVLWVYTGLEIGAPPEIR